MDITKIHQRFTKHTHSCHSYPLVKWTSPRSWGAPAAPLYSAHFKAKVLGAMFKRPAAWPSAIMCPDVKNPPETSTKSGQRWILECQCQWCFRIHLISWRMDDGRCELQQSPTSYTCKAHVDLKSIDFFVSNFTMPLFFWWFLFG